ELYFFELVLPDQPARVLAVAPRFAAEAWRVGAVADRQLARLEDLVGVDVRAWNFRGGNKIKRLRRRAAWLSRRRHRLEEIGLELRELSRARHRLRVDEERRPDLLVTVLLVRIEHEADERGLQARRVALEQ